MGNSRFKPCHSQTFQHKSLDSAPTEVILMSSKKNCGCGQDPCKTYGAENSGFDPVVLCKTCGYETSIMEWPRGKNKYTCNCEYMGDIVVICKSCKKETTYNSYDYGYCGCAPSKNAETFEARENKDGTIVLTNNEWDSCIHLYNGNYLYGNLELKLIDEGLKSGFKFKKETIHGYEALQMIHLYERLLRKRNVRSYPNPNKRYGAETFEARTNRKSNTDPFVNYDEITFMPKNDTDELREEIAMSKMVSVPDGKHQTRRYDRHTRKRKGHKRLNNPKKTDYDNQSLGQDFFKKMQQGKEDMRNNAETFEAKVYDPMMQKKIDQNECTHKFGDGEDAWNLVYSDIDRNELSYVYAQVKCEICSQKRYGSWGINEREGFEIVKGEEGRMPKMYGFYGAESHRDSKGRFTEKPLLTGSVIGGFALGLMYFVGHRKIIGRK